MESDQNHPHTQLAFLLNRDQHWCPLRRFGHSAENCRWFKLDSDHPSPQWISKTDLGILLQQAERDGYTIFVVVPIEPGGGLPRTDADDFASTLEPEPSAASPASASPTSEDIDLQVALQASLMGGVAAASANNDGVFNMSDSHPPPLTHSARTSPDPIPESTTSITDSQPCRSDPNIPPNRDRGRNAEADQPAGQSSNVSVNETGTEIHGEENNATGSEAPREVDVEEMRRRRLERFGNLDTIVKQRQRQTRKRPTLRDPKRSGKN
ncbi:hypothetical protein PAXRUDRAFT_830120 [Paxillus rubicundulus Ve08.2h10]|uniref:ubiquitinyl hydrolase 1 n=1 Tax=Paxillus rubicundulus Ve08.2h10 TaxID=930991 RepID=A0A0D0D653_9AGAM|nr:hypothetical protein PAXRUDRAFT_830120 [Paxillus rubicundulus Ve08.2h10]